MRRRWVLWLTLGAVAAICVVPVGYLLVNRELRESAAVAELDRLRLPAEWEAQYDRYEGPRFGSTTYASVTREFKDVPTPLDELVAAVGDAAQRAGWVVDTDYESGSYAPSCDTVDGCWSKGRYRLFAHGWTYDRTSETAPEYREYLACPNPPHRRCTSFRVEITYLP